MGKAEWGDRPPRGCVRVPDSRALGGRALLVNSWVISLSWMMAAKKKIRKEISSPGKTWEAGRKSMERLFEETGEALRTARKDYGTSSERNQLEEVSKCGASPRLLPTTVH